jgi:hypothetical protein
MQLIVTDSSAAALDNCARTLARNGVPSRRAAALSALPPPPPSPTHKDDGGFAGAPVATLCHLDWAEVGVIGNADVILAADVVYDPGVIPVLVRRLATELGSSSAASTTAPTALIASERRNCGTHEAFRAACTAMGMQTRVLKEAQGRIKEDEVKTAQTIELGVHFCECATLREAVAVAPLILEEVTLVGQSWACV